MKISVRRPSCPYCKTEIAPEQAKSGCSTCMAWQHTACAGESGGCAACGAPLVAAPGPGARGELAFRVFASTWSSWGELCQQAASFATSLGEGRVVDISHSADQGEGTIAVWYRTDGPARGGERLDYEIFRSAWASWGELFRDAARAARQGRPLGFSHCEDKNEGVVVAWYWV